MPCYHNERGEVVTHIFTADTTAPPRELPCDCGEVTWGEMDDVEMLTKMWEASA